METIKEKYRMGFNIWGLILFVVIMTPNVIWALCPAPNDVLRGESITEITDMIGSICQIVMIASLCGFINRSCGKLKLTFYIVITLIASVLYFAGWVLYYIGLSNWIVILLLTLSPCMAFFFFSLDRKNVLALAATIGFTICHLIYAFQNFIF